MSIERPGYPSEEKQFWNETVIPALDQLREENPESADLQFLDMVIRNRQFLAIRDFNINIDGISLRISPEETKETALAKLDEFFSAMTDRKDENEEVYTSEDQRFWREHIIPSLNELQEEFGTDPGFKLLTLMIEKRMLTSSSKATGLDITIKGIRLRTNPKNSKKDIQRKLARFLGALKEGAVPEAYIEGRVEKTRDSVREKLGKNWNTLQEQRAGEIKEIDAYRYSPEDQLMWRSYIVPNLEGLLEAYPRSADFKRLVDAIFNRDYLTAGAWRLEVGGVKLNVKAKDAQGEKQEKLKNFLIELQEATYTRPDKVFWNEVVLPGLAELQEIYGNDSEMQLLVMTVEERIFHESRRAGGLNISISGIKLRIEKEDSKLEAQKKLETFINELKKYSEKDGLDRIKREMKLRIERLEEELAKREIRNRQIERKNAELEEKRRAIEEVVGDMKIKMHHIEQEARRVESEASRLRSSGYSSYRPSYSSAGESGYGRSSE